MLPPPTGKRVRYFAITNGFIDIDMFLEGAELENEGEDQDQNEEHYTSDFVVEDKQATALGIQGEGIGPQSSK